MTPWHLSCGSWNLVPWPGTERSLPPLEAQSLSHWNTREVPPFISSSIIWVSLIVWDVMISQALKFWFPLAPLCQPFRGELSDSSCTLFSPFLLFPFIHHLSILPLSLVPRAPDGSLTSAHLCLYISEAECKRCSDLSRLGKGGTDFWMTALLRSLENEFQEKSRTNSETD